MKAIRRFIGILGDSPTYDRDRANLISGFTIGTAGLLLNAAVMFLVMPLMLDPDDRDFRSITENVEFGQLLALILLGGATGFATLLIPLRLLSVFWGPRVGRYFDQIVLSGISPLRFVIGKVMSQNLFLALILFLLFPYLVLSLTLGGVDLWFFLGGLFLVWLYCMALALVTLWVSLYLNELLAAAFVIAGAVFISACGCTPIPYQPFVFTPFPALVRPIYQSMPYFRGDMTTSWETLFIACSVGMSCIICVSLAAINIGPLYGITRDNSTFGEVVRAGDSKRKRWFRLRYHIQRPSELAFFYENRDLESRRNDGAKRWGFGLGGMLFLSLGVSAGIVYLITYSLTARGGVVSGWMPYEFHTINLSVYGVGLILAVFVFSHPKNSTYLRVPFLLGRTVEVSKLDTACFLIFVAVSSAAAIAVPFGLERFVVAPFAKGTLFPEFIYGDEGARADYSRIVLEGVLVLSLCALVIYSIHRVLCLMTWLRTVAVVGTTAFYLLLVCLIPFVCAMMFMTIDELKAIPALVEWAPTIGMSSPFIVMGFLFKEIPEERFPRDLPITSFYVVHITLLILILFWIFKRGRAVRNEYLAASQLDSA